MTPALYVLRCKEVGFQLDELDKLEIGFIFDVFTEKLNDSADYDTVASQEDFDRF